MLDLGANAENTLQSTASICCDGVLLCWKCTRGIQNHAWSIEQWDRSSKGDPLRKETYQLLSVDESIYFCWKCGSAWLDGWRCWCCWRMGSREMLYWKPWKEQLLESLSSWNKRLLLETGRKLAFLLKDVWNHWSKLGISQMLEERSCLVKNLLLKRMVRVMPVAYSTIRRFDHVRDRCWPGKSWRNCRRKGNKR